MAETNQDQWTQWLLRRRHGGDAAQLEAMLPALYRTRDKVLDWAQIAEGDVVLDVGAGDGLIAFGALPLIGEHGRIIFSDLSQDLLDHSRQLAAEMGALDRIEFVHASADDLSMVTDSSVDVVTTRSVLIYVDRKSEAFAEFFRVLRPGGRISIWEPINRFGHPGPENEFLGIDVTPIRDIAAKVNAVFEGIQPAETDPMLNFDERDLLRLAEEAGFSEIHLGFEARIKPAEPRRWDVMWESSGNPKIPTLREAVSDVLSPHEAKAFVEHMRPRVENGERIERMASAHLWGTRSYSERADRRIRESVLRWQ